MMTMFEEDVAGAAAAAAASYELCRLCIEGISSPIAAHILDFCDDGLGDNLFAAVTSTSDPFAASSEDVSSSSAATPPLCSYSDDITAVAATAFSPLPFDSTLSALLDEEQNPVPDNEFLPPTDETLTASAYYPAATEDTSIEQFGQIQLPETIAAPMSVMQMSSTAPMLMSLAAGYDEECITAALSGGYMSLDGALYQQTGAMIPNCNAEAPQVGFFNSSSTDNNGMVVLDMNEMGEYQRMMEGEGLTTTYSDTDSIQGAYSNTADMQMGGNNQQLVNGCNGSPPTLPPTEISGLEDSFKVVRLSAEQRKEKIHRYIKKRNERNFSKKIKYACRKTLADSRPRVRGRFAKNDELCEVTRSSSQNHEQYEQSAGTNAEDMLLDSSDFLAHLSGINSYDYKYNCTIESWI